MSLTPSKVPWDSNRLKAHEWVINYDSNGNAVLGKKETDYTNVKYNFASLPSGTSTTSQTQTGTTAQSGTTTQQQTSEAFGDVKPYYWDDKDNDVGNKELTGSGYGGAQPPDNTLSGFFKPLEDAAQGKKIGSLGQRVKQKFEDITGKTERDWEDVDRDIEIDEITKQLKTADYEEEASLRKRLDELLDSRRDTTIGSKIGKAPQVFGLGAKVIGGVFDAILGVTEADRQRQRHAKQYFRKKGIKTRGELGSSVDPGRIAGNPSTDLFAGMNAISAKGDLSIAGYKRITTRNSKKTQDRLKNRYGANSEKVKEFNQNTKNMEIELSNFNNDKKDYDHRTTPGVAEEHKQTESRGKQDLGSSYNVGTYCFDPDTCVQMIDGSKKEIKNIQLGDNTKGGEVTGIFQFKPTDEIHDYKGIKVAGSHYVKEDGKFIMVQDSPLSVKIDKIPVVYSLDTTDRRIFINDIEFADYNGDGIAKGFLHNAGLNINGFNKEVLRQVEQRLI
jgi:hypothetical protein